MNVRTEVKKTQLMPEFSNRFVYILITAALATLLAVFGARILWRDIFVNDFLAKPEKMAAEITVGYAISEFQGNPITEVPSISKWSMLAVILLSFVFAPVGLLLGWRSILSTKSHQQETYAGSKPHWRAILLVIVSGILLGHLFIINLGGAIVGPWAFKTLQLDNAVDQNRSYVISELSHVGVKAFQYYFLPVELGGGGRSFRSHLDAATDHWVSLKELDVPSATAVGSYSIRKIENDTIMVLRGVGNFRLSDGTFPEYEARLWPSMDSQVQLPTYTKIN